MNIGFLCNSMCFLRYYVPIFREMDDYENINKILYIRKRDKYDEPRRYLKVLDKLGEEFGFETRGTSEISKRDHGFFLTMEGELADLANAMVYSMTYQTDFRISLPKYRDKVSAVFVPSEFISNYYGADHHCLKFFTPTKYSTRFIKHDVGVKYGVSLFSKNVLLIFPRTRDLDKELVSNVINILEKRGYNVIIKTRGKDKVDQVFYYGGLRQVFEDFSWHPHTTQELLSISNFAINFDSTAIEECLFANVPVINFPCKTHRERGLDFLYSENFCLDKSPKDKTISGGDILWAEASRGKNFSKTRNKFYNARDGSVINMVSWMLDQ